MIQTEADVMLVDLLHRLDQRRQLHRLRVREAALGDLVPWVRRVEHALEAEQHVVGVQRATGAEIVGAVELHALAQLEIVGQAVRGDRPALRQSRHHLAARGVELDQAVHQHVGGGIGGGQRVVLHHVETFGTGLGAHAQGGGGAGQGRGEQQGEEGETHDGLHCEGDNARPWSGRGHARRMGHLERLTLDHAPATDNRGIRRTAGAAGPVASGPAVGKPVLALRRGGSF
ncbi:hypothetical protein D3C78_974970 [compost metagenome]